VPTAPDVHRGTYDTISAVLLAGGASSRMGRDRAHLSFAGQPAATRITSLLAGLFGEVLIAGGDPPESAVGRRVADQGEPQCALRGLVTALTAATRERVLVVATDLPLVTADLLLALVAWPEADAVVPSVNGRLQPLCALYRREPVLAVARSRLAAGGDLAVRGLLEEIDTVTLEAADVAQVDPDGTALFNVNTPEDLERALEASRR
jgi:molybdopterin-guanine dinucleotide biosynthesis protein A